MRSRRIPAFFAGFVVTLLGALGGCNGLLGNEEGTLLLADAAPETSPEGSTADDAGADVLIADASFDSALVCDLAKKACLEYRTCVDKDEPDFGCGNADCAPCGGDNASSTTCIGDPDAGTLVCKVTCLPGFKDCDGLPANGCEVDLSEPSSCGDCTQTCQTGEFCTSTAPGVFGCQSNCTAPKKECETGKCSDLQTDKDHCGDCMIACDAPNHANAKCVGGTCGFDCVPNYHKCQGFCRADTDEKRCGSQCVDCTADSRVTSGNMVARCESGACAYACKATYDDCDGDPGNGCEADLFELPNCGKCGRRCGNVVIIPPLLGQQCCSGACTPLSETCPHVQGR